MTKKNFYSIILSILICNITSGSEPISVKVIGEPVIENNLVGVDKLYIVLSFDIFTDNNINAEEIKTELKKRLDLAGIMVEKETPVDPDSARSKTMAELLTRRGVLGENLRFRSGKIPELIVRVSIAQSDSEQTAYHVQTSLARRVYMKASVRSAGKAEVWRIDRPIGFADANSLAEWVKSETTGQVDAFIAAWQKANKKSDSQEKGKSLTSTTTGTTGNYSPGANKADAVKDKYVASKNSKVFHKPTCPSAKRISSDNLIGFETRGKAIQSGRRPCKICKP